MKWFAVYAVLVSVAVSVTEAVVRGADQQNSVERKLQPNDYEPWEQDTAVYYEFEDGWYWGTITAYNDGEYATVWSDDEVEVFSYDVVDQMVQNAVADEPWEQGTVVYYEFDDGWYWGTITAYSDDEYTTTWSDGKVEVFSNDIVNQMVEGAADDNAWDVGTFLYYKWPEEDGWYWGTITAYDTGAYTTSWFYKDDEVFTDKTIVDQMAEDADDNAWDVGTVIYYEWPSGWYWGTITGYVNGAYKTTWSDGDNDIDEEVFNDLAVVNQMVEDASQARGSADVNRTNKKPAVIGRVILVLAVFAAAGAAAFFLERRQRQKRQETLEETVESISAQLETDLPFIT